MPALCEYFLISSSGENEPVKWAVELTQRGATYRRLQLRPAYRREVRNGTDEACWNDQVGCCRPGEDDLPCFGYCQVNAVEASR